MTVFINLLFLGSVSAEDTSANVTGKNADVNLTTNNDNKTTESDALYSYLNLIESWFKIVDEDIEKMYSDLFIDTSKEDGWIIPYFNLIFNKLETIIPDVNSFIKYKNNHSS